MVINVQLNKTTTMRKEYSKPELMVVILKTHHIMTQSLPQGRSYQEDDVVLGKQGFGGWEDDVEPGEDY